nr:hypothetical protein [Tanacetum cinerariifolium]
DELYDKELKHIKADNQAIQTILLGLPEDIYAAIDSCETAQEIWLRVQQMMKGFDIGIQEKKDNQNGVDMLLLFIRPRTCTQLITLNSPHQDQSSFNQNYLQQPMQNPEDIIDPTTAFKLNYSTPTNNNQRISSNPRNRQIAQPGMNMGQDRQMEIVRARAERNAAGQNGNQIRCYNCRGVGIQLQAEEYDLMAAATDLDEIEEVNANCILMANLQQASTSGT